jgi:hypothetical protein
MMVQGKDCVLTIKTSRCEIDIPYSDETLREAVSLLEEEAAIEGDGICRAIRKIGGVTGCVITPLTIGTAPLLLQLAMGGAGLPVFVSETRNLYKCQLNLLPLEDTDLFDLIQERQMSNEREPSVRLGMSNERKLYEGCRVKGFELRILRDEAIKLKLDIASEWPPAVYPYSDTFEKVNGERFSGDCVTYRINGKEYKNIYGITLVSRKEGGTKTELWIKRALEAGPDFPQIIDEFIFTVQLQREKYEYKYFGTFRITIKKLVLTSDETNVNSSDTVIGPLRYYVADTVSTEVFISGEEVAT